MAAVNKGKLCFCYLPYFVFSGVFSRLGAINMCCDGWDNSGGHVGQCPDCGGDIDSNGQATIGCFYSPVYCDTCGDRPCDDSC